MDLIWCYARSEAEKRGRLEDGGKWEVQLNKNPSNHKAAIYNERGFNGS